MHTQIKEFILVSVFSFSVYIFFYVAVVFTGLNPLILQSDDLVPNATLPYSMILHGTIYLDDYVDMFDKNYPARFYRREHNGHTLSYFSYLTPLVAAPVYIVESLIQPEVTIDNVRHMSRISGAYITALATAAFWLVLRKSLKNTKHQLLLLTIFVFGTTTISICSQGIWEHASSELFLSLGVYLLLIRKYGWAGAVFALATIARPTNFLSFMAFLTYLVILKRKEVLKYLIPGAALIAIDLLIKQYFYGSLFNTGYGSEVHKFTLEFTGVLGMWFSPSKGILASSPVLAFAFYGMYKSIHTFFKLWEIDLNTVFTGIILVHTTIMGLWYSWYGGYSWTYRMSADIVPYFILMLIPFVTSKYFSNIVWKSVFYFLAGISLFFQILGVLYFDGLWHRAFESSGDAWLWDVWNSQPIFSARRFFFKMLKVGADPFAGNSPYR